MPHKSKESTEHKKKLSPLERYTLFVLFYINMLNYMDRFIVAGILSILQEELGMENDKAGLLQTAFIIAFATTAPIFGYLGDRVSRRLIMILSVMIWSGATLAGSFTSTFGWFFLTRLFVGVGEASFTSIAPTVVYDVTYVGIRKDALTLFFLATPLGAGLGFAVGSGSASIGGHWHWGLRVTPLVALIGIIMLCFIKDPTRGERERIELGVTHTTERNTSYLDDLKELSRNKSFILSTLGFTCATFVSGALSWWAPTFLHSAFRLIPGEENISQTWVSVWIGVIAVITGCIGVPLGSHISQSLADRYPRVDPIVCSVGLLTASPIVTVAIFSANKSIAVTFICITFGQLSMNMIWTLVADMLLSAVLPEIRSTAESLQIAVSHTFGDAGSPFLLGLLSELLKRRWREQQTQESYDKKKIYYQFKSLQLSMLTMIVIQFIGGTMFALNSLYIVDDRAFVQKAIRRHKSEENVRKIEGDSSSSNETTTSSEVTSSSGTTSSSSTE